MSQWLFSLKPLTPLHIGSGDTIEPYEYAVLGNRLHHFDTYELLLRLPPKLQDEFLSLVSSHVGKLQRLLHREAAFIKQDSLSQFNVPLTLEAQWLYQQQLDNPQARLTIYPFIRTSGKPFIPGSSLKGAIRTALLYHKARKPIETRSAKQLEQEAFAYERITDDPFKTLKISDSQPSTDCTEISALWVHTRRQKSWQKSIPMFREITLSQFTHSSAPTFTHSVKLTEEISQYQPKFRRLTMEEVITSCRSFYGLHASKERNYLENLPQTGELYAKLNELFSELPHNSFPIRFGWGSGFDAVTVNYAAREPRTTRSRRLVENGIPLGWAAVEVKAC
jgi:CRISPR-associated protein Csm5